MPKPIRLTPALIQQMMVEFGQTLSGLKLSDGKVSYTKAFTYEGNDDTKAVVLFEPMAYAKMLMLLHTFDSEVGWHGTVERLDEKTFVIKDIFVYPQEVTGATVTPDQEKYQTWMMELDDDTFNSLHMQGHSHVNMSTSPSGVDTAFYDSILDQLGDDDYYIFMIFNKRLERTVKIYDMQSNTLYENSDVSIGIRCEDGDLEQFIADAKDDVEKKAYNYKASVTPIAGAKEVKKNGDVSQKSSGQSDFSKYPGYYGGYGAGGYGSGRGYGADERVDYDAEIFGRRADWWND